MKKLRFEIESLRGKDSLDNFEFIMLYTELEKYNEALEVATNSLYEIMKIGTTSHSNTVEAEIAYETLCKLGDFE
jgi:hypothetical protein